MGVRAWQIGVTVAEVFLVGVAIFLSLVTFSPLAYWMVDRIQKFGNWLSRRKALILLIVLLDAFFLVFITMGKYYRYQTDWFVQGLFIWTTGIVAGLLLAAGWPKRGFFVWLVFGLVGGGFLLQAGVILSRVTDYPFSETWSEGMLLFNAAQFAGKKIWGQSVGWPTINPSHAIMQSLPFLLPGTQALWVHRLWNSILWLIFPLIMGFALVKRLGSEKLIIGLLFVLWGFSFLNQAPVYFNLLVIPILILIGFRSHQFGRSLVVVLLAAFWAGISRLNWYPMPGALAAFLFFLEVPYPGKFWGYFWKPLTWVGVSSVMGFVTNRAYLIISGHDSQFTYTALQSPLLWNRLLPNSTNPIGILPEFLVVCSGMLILVSWKVFASSGLHFWRKYGLLAILLIFFLGGLVVSTKIGGGDNLHNFDGLFVLLTICGAYIFFNHIIPDHQTIQGSPVPTWLISWLIILPVVSQMLYIPFKVPITPDKIADLDTELSLKVAKAQATGKPILFISQTHFLAINHFPGVIPEPKYEIVWMMEMAMANKEKYFNEFYEKLSDREWGLIVVDSVITEVVEREKEFGEEQNAWVRWVSNPLLKYYNPVLDNRSVGIVLLTPRK
jgi:hypothetical protein